MIFPSLSSFCRFFVAVLLVGCLALWDVSLAQAQNAPPVTIQLSLNQTIFGIGAEVKGKVAAFDDQGNQVTMYPGGIGRIRITVSLDAAHQVTVDAGDPSGFTIPTNTPFLDAGVYFVTASDASVGGTRMGDVTESVTLVKAIIKRDGVDITDPRGGAQPPLTQVSVGEMMNLSVEITPAVTVQSPSRNWSVPGIFHKDWSPNNTVSYKPLMVSQTELTSSPLSFYWVDGATSRTVLCNITSPGANSFSVTARATFQVNRPDDSFRVIRMGDVAFDSSWIEAKGAPTLHFGNRLGDPGVGFLIAGDAALLKQGDNYCIVQTAKSGSRFARDAQDKWFNWSPSTGLDSDIGTTDFCYPGDNDSPFVTVLTTDQEIAVSETYTDVLMYKPSTPGANWVPLKTLEWSWAGIAVKAGAVWQNSDLQIKIAATSMDGSDTNEYPTWSNNAKIDAGFQPRP